MTQHDNRHEDEMGASAGAAGAGVTSGSDCGCGGRRMPRRHFLQVAGLGMVGTTLARRAAGAMAGPFDKADTVAGHLVPADKKLDPAWVRSLFERGVKEVFRGKSLDTIGMPCGGIGSGQLYLCGDGTLGCWQIFNDASSNWVDKTHATYTHKGIPKPFKQGFAVSVRDGGGTTMKTLSREGFTDVEFQGEYPIALVRYAEVGCPVKVEMEAFSPFIPLNARDSSLPCTVFSITVENVSGGTVQAGVAGWLENAVCYQYAARFGGLRRTSVRYANGRGMLSHGALEPPPVKEPAPTEPERPAIAFEDFEGDDYGEWKVTGTAFGTKPAKGTLPNQIEVGGFQGKGLVNSFRGGDNAQGTLTSPKFIIERRHINFLVGGGSHANQTCVDLKVGGKTVRQARGRDNEQLTWRSWDVSEFEGKKAQIRIIDKATGGWGHINVDQIEFADRKRKDERTSMERATDFGTLALACKAGPGAGGQGAIPEGVAGGACVTEGDHEYDAKEDRVGLLRAGDVEIAPGKTHTFTFVLGWHFPNQAHGHVYEVHYPDADAVVAYVLDNRERLVTETRRWRDTYYDSTLPYWLLDRLHSTVSYLATGTCQWWKNGRFWAYEGVTCCEGTCTHVWNYAHSHARLFPELGRSIREMQDFCLREEGGGFHEDTGLVGFRSNDAYAADGQCGTILKAYREHLTSPDNAFLERNWPRIKKALEYSISRDANADGLIEDTQHNTYDINYHGANTFVGALYLAALRAGEEMAQIVGDGNFARRARMLHESGRELTMARLWGGEYFVQDVDLDRYPKHQYKDGCLSDHLFGQGWAHQVKLGYLYPEENVKKALQSVWKYNWAPDVAPYNEAFQPFRWFITPGQAGLFTCTWPNGNYLPEGTVYKNEVWTGIEYQVAGHMVWEGMVEEGLAICRAVHDRYHPDLFNPYNEVECGDHYARAMASWGVYLALAGFEYDGPRGAIGFAPRITPEAFRVAFTAAEGWGMFEQTRDGRKQQERLTIRWGRMRLETLAFALHEDARRAGVTVKVGDRTVKANVRVEDGRATVTLDKAVVLKEGETLEVTLKA
ncbi:MAG: hypothetical protein GWP08_01820 [Nitrospiraceae bacterium]|nr:hypothetical protein [Nitrospiraceae bacterium]